MEVRSERAAERSQSTRTFILAGIAMHGWYGLLGSALAAAQSRACAESEEKGKKIAESSGLELSAIQFLDLSSLNRRSSSVFFFSSSNDEFDWIKHFMGSQIPDGPAHFAAENPIRAVVAWVAE